MLNVTLRRLQFLASIRDTAWAGRRRSMKRSFDRYRRDRGCSFVQAASFLCIHAHAALLSPSISSFGNLQLLHGLQPPTLLALPPRQPLPLAHQPQQQPPPHQVELWHPSFKRSTPSSRNSRRSGRPRTPSSSRPGAISSCPAFATRCSSRSSTSTRTGATPRFPLPPPDAFRRRSRLN